MAKNDKGVKSENVLCDDCQQAIPPDWDGSLDADGIPHGRSLCPGCSADAERAAAREVECEDEEDTDETDE